jgi:hypothetical protein
MIHHNCIITINSVCLTCVEGWKAKDVCAYKEQYHNASQQNVAATVSLYMWLTHQSALRWRYSE